MTLNISNFVRQYGVKLNKIKNIFFIMFGPNIFSINKKAL